jgi:hypothetical protein
MPFVLPPGIAEGSQEATNLRLKYQVAQSDAAASAVTNLVALGYQQISNAHLETVQMLTVPAGATIADVQNNGAQRCRWRDDGGSPTPTTGRVISADDTERLMGNLGQVRLIRAADGVTLDISYYKAGA